MATTPTTLSIVLFSVTTPIGLVGIVTCAVLWHLNRDIKPLNARLYPFVVHFHVTNALLIIALWWQALHVAAKESEASYIANYVLFCQLLNNYLMVCFRLWFIFNLTGSKVSFQSKEIAGETPVENGFLRRRYLMEPTFLYKVFAIFCIVQASVFAVAIPPLRLLDTDPAIDWLNYMLIPLAGVYCIVFFVLVLLLRKARDGFMVKSELMVVGLWWLFILAISIIIPFFPSVKQNMSTLYFGAIALIGGYAASIAWPLAVGMRREKKSQREFSLSDLSPASTNLQTLDGVLANEELKALFVDFLSRLFQVESFFFLADLAVYKKNPPIRPGKAVLMYQKYLTPKSLMDLQLPHDEYLDIEQVCTTEDRYLEEGEFTEHFFDNVEAIVRQRLNDNFNLFMVSPEYLQVVTTEKEKERLADGFSAIGVK